MKTLRTLFARMTVVILAAVLFTAGTAFAQEPPPTVMTDKEDYSPGDRVIVTGTGWQTAETVMLVFVHTMESCPPDTLYATADGDGNMFNDEFLIEEMHRGVTFTLTATGMTSGWTAVVRFTDAAMTSATSGNWNSTSTWVNGAIPGLNDDVTIANDHVVTVTDNHSAKSITIAGTDRDTRLDINAGQTLTVGTGGVSILATTSNNKINEMRVGSGTLTVSGNLMITGAGTGTNRKSDLTISTGIVTVTGNISTTNVDARIIFSSTGLIRVGGTFGTGGTITPSTGTIEYNGAGAQTILATTYNNLSTSSSGTKTLSAGGTTVNNIFTIGSGTTVDVAGIQPTILGGGSLVVNGTLDFSSSTGLIRSGTSGTTTLTMGAIGLIRTIDADGLGPASNASLQTQTGGSWDVSSISSNGTVEYSRSTTSGQTVTDGDYNNLTISGSTQTKTWTLTATRTVNGNLTVEASAPFTLSGAQTLNLKGNWSNSGSLTAGSSTVVMNGTSAQTMSGSTFNNLTINNGSGVTLLSNQTVNGTLTLTSGVVTTGLNTLTVGASGSILGGSSSTHISGKLARIIPAAQINSAKAFPVGKGGNYRPMSFNYTGLSGTSTVTAEQFETALTGTLPPNISLFSSRYWNVTQSGGSSFTYNITLDGTGFSPTGTAKILKKDGSIVAHDATFSSPNYTATGLTSLSDFAFGETTSIAPSVDTNPSDSTITYGNNASFTAAASGTPTPTVQWQEKVGAGAFANIANGGVYSGATTTTLTLTNPPVSMSTNQYQAVFTNTAGNVTTTAATLTVNKAASTISATGTTVFTYNGSAQGPSTSTVTGSGGAVSYSYSGTGSITYGPSATAPSGAGTYQVVASVAADANYNGASSSAYAFTIDKASSVTTVTIVGGPFTYTGLAITPASVTVTGANLSLTPAPAYLNNTNAGTATASYTYAESANHLGSNDSKTFEIGKATATVALGNLAPTYTGSGIAATATTDPTGLTVEFTYDGAATLPVNAGTYTVVGTINEANYEGSATDDMVIGKAPTTTVVTITGAPFTYTGLAITPASVTVTGANLSLTPAPAYLNNTNAGTATASYTYAESANHLGSNDSKTFEIGKATATVALGNLAPTYTGSGIAATATTDPTGLTVEFTYDGSATLPVNAGTYTVVGTINEANYEGSANANMVIGKAPTTTVVTITGAPFTYTGLAITPASVTVTGANLSLTPAPVYLNNINAGTANASYTYAESANHLGSNDSKTFEIGKATATVALGNLAPTYTGSGIAATATTTPTGLTVEFTYDGAATLPVNAGTYAVVGTINDANYQGSANDDMVIGKAPTTTVVTITGAPFTYTGLAITPASVTVIGANLSLTPAPVYLNNINAGTANASYTYAESANHFGSTDNKDFTIGKATATVALGNLAPTYTGSGIAATATTDPTGLTVEFTYDGSSTLPFNAGTYAVIGTINEANYEGSANANMVIGKASTTTVVTIAAGPFTYTGSAITPASVTVTGANLSLTPAPDYANNINAGTATASYTYAESANHLGSSDSEDFAIGKAATVTTVTITGAPFTYTGSAITPASVTVTGANLSLTPAPVYLNNINAGTANASYTYAESANHFGSSDSKNFTITKKPITGNFTVDATKVYDGGTLANVLTRTLNDVVGLDDVSLTGGTANYDTKHVGTSKIVTLTSMTLSGAAAGNYSLTSVATTTANITGRPINVTAQTDSRLYNGTTSSSVAPVVGSLQTGDVVGTYPTQTYDNRNVGTVKTLTPAGLVITDGNDGNNYSITYVPDFTGVIIVRPITVNAVTNTKVYDGNTSALAVPTYTPFQSGDVLGTAPTEVYDTPLVGTGKTMTASGLVINDGNSGNNYSIGYVQNFTGIITLASTTTTLITSAASVRFMDYLTMTAQIKPLNTATPLTGTVQFKIGTVIYGSATVVPIPGDPEGRVQATLIPQVTNLPGNYTVEAIFTSTNTNYSGSSNTKPLTVVARTASPYVATGFYTGDLFAWTTSTSTSTATVTLAAAIKDSNDPTGDVRGAKVTFYFVNGTTLTPIPSAQNLPVGLINIDDGSVGTASAIVQLNIGSANAASFQIAVGITGAYTNNPGHALSQTIVTVSKPVAGGYIVGGGQVNNMNSAGYIKGHSTVNTDYQFDIQYTKSGTNPKGKTKIFVRSYHKPDGVLDSALHTYIITTNAIALLNVGLPLATGTFSAKANMVEQLADLTTVGIESGATFQMQVFQNACDQQIAITYHRRAGGIWFSSNWNTVSASTMLKPVFSRSSVYVAGGGSCTASAPLTSGAGVNPEPGLKFIPEEYALFQNYPNPFNPSTLVQFDLPEESQVKITVYDVIGRQVEVMVSGLVEAGRYQQQWSGSNVDGNQLGSGIYLLRMEAQSTTSERRLVETKKMILLR